MKYLYQGFLTTLMLFSNTSFANENYPATKIIAGYIENVILFSNQVMEAKMDTGADITSLNVANVTYFNQSNVQMVSFDIINHHRIIKHAIYPLIKIISLKKRHNENSMTLKDKRPLIQMEVCIANKKANILVNLVDRDGFDYSLLIGRQAIIKFNLLIDASKRNLTVSVCLL
jgi:hypothetical protein